MGSGKGDSYHHYCIICIYRWNKPSRPINRCRVLCRRYLFKFTELCGWYGITYTHSNCSSDTVWSMLRIWDCKSLWYDGVTHYQWNYVVQMGSGKGDSYPHCCIMYIYRWPKPSPPSNRCRVLCRRCLGKFTELCGWYGVTCTLGNCSSDTLGGMSCIRLTSWHCIQQRKQFVCWSVQNNHRVCSQQESGLEMRHFGLWRNFVT